MNTTASSVEFGGVLVDAAELRQFRKRREVVTLPSLVIEPGITALLGPNGAGKSTLLETIATALPLRHGTLQVCGHDARSEFGRQQIRRVAGFLPQRFDPPGTFTLLDFLSYVAWTKEVPSANLESAAWRVLEIVGLTDRANDRIRTLSGGMRQRLGIATALVHQPSFLILDEPTVGLDVEQRHDFRQILLEIGSSVSTLLSTHLTDDVEAICDRVVVMNVGAVQFHGTVDDLSSNAPQHAITGKENRRDLSHNRIEAGYLDLIRAKR